MMQASSITSLVSRRILGRNFSTKTGTVKFYKKNERYGFIKNDDGSEIFVHRSGIQSRFSPEDSPFHPNLRADEVVQYKVKTDESGKETAVDVTFANGRRVPPLRRGFLHAKHLRVGEMLLSCCVDITNDTSITEEEQEKGMFEVVRRACRELRAANELIDKLGYTKDRFPVPPLRKFRSRDGSAAKFDIEEDE